MANEFVHEYDASGWDLQSIQAYAKATALINYRLMGIDRPLSATRLEKLCDYPFDQFTILYKEARHLFDFNADTLWAERLNAVMAEINLAAAPHGRLNADQQGAWLLAYHHELHDLTYHVMTVKEAADVLGLSVSRVRQLAESGDLKAEKDGRAWKIDRESVIQYWKTHKKR